MKKILLIEDNDDIRNNTAEILELSNYTVITAADGITGIEQAISHCPDLIICDIMMPGLDGYGVLHALHRNESIKNTPFIFLTAKADRNDQRKGMELGADDYITKPFSGTELLNAVDSRINKIDLLKQELTRGIEGGEHLFKSGPVKSIISTLTENRNINKYKRKQMIYREGNHPNRVYYLIKGKVKAFKTNEDGKELVVELYGPGDFMGYVALLEGTVYNDTAQAIEETEVAVIPREEFDELINNHKELTHKFIRLLAKNIVEKENHLLGLAYNSLRRKVADALLMLKHKYQQTAEKNFVIDINRESLATIAGTAKESLIRTLSEFKSEGLVDILDDGNIIITNTKKLENLAN